jgi:hypothetical protein
MVTGRDTGVSSTSLLVLAGGRGAGHKSVRRAESMCPISSKMVLNPMQVAAIIGYKTLQMLKRYTHLRAEDLAKML